MPFIQNGEALIYWHRITSRNLTATTTDTKYRRGDGLVLGNGDFVHGRPNGLRHHALGTTSVVVARPHIPRNCLPSTSGGSTLHHRSSAGAS
ncbi:hypothetical protein VNI00_018083, partial [Paramarasmius palmivorus]